MFSWPCKTELFNYNRAMRCGGKQTLWRVFFLMWRFLSFFSPLFVFYAKYHTFNGISESCKKNIAIWTYYLQLQGEKRDFLIKSRSTKKYRKQTLGKDFFFMWRHLDFFFPFVCFSTHNTGLLMEYLRVAKNIAIWTYYLQLQGKNIYFLINYRMKKARFSSRLL